MYSHSLSSLPLVSDSKNMTALQNLQHLLSLLGPLTSTVSGYGRNSRLFYCQLYIQLVTPNAEVHVDIMCSHNSTYVKWHGTLLSPKGSTHFCQLEGNLC